MTQLEQMRADHGPAVLDFELVNLDYFALSVSDRGDEFFDQFTEDFGRLLAEQQQGKSMFHVLVNNVGSVFGRFNLYDLNDGAATLGYRVAQHAAGRGVATATVRELCAVAARLGLHTLTAATSDQNVASRKVLINAGFVLDGPADPSELGGKHGSRFRRNLANQ